MSCFKVKPRTQVTKSTVTIRHQKHNIWQPYVLLGHLARHPLPKTCSNNRMDFFFFCDYAQSFRQKVLCYGYVKHTVPSSILNHFRAFPISRTDTSTMGNLCGLVSPC